MPREGGASSTPRPLKQNSAVTEYWITRLRGSDLILRECECISNLTLRSAPLRASRRRAASPCVVTILRAACGVYHRADLRADQVAILSGCRKKPISCRLTTPPDTHPPTHPPILPTL